MKRLSTALVQAGEAVMIVALGVAIPLAPLLLIWGVDLGFSGDLSLMWRGAIDAWLVSTGVDVGVTIDSLLAQTLGVPGADEPFVISLGALGGAMVILAIAARSGAKLATSEYPISGIVGGAVTIAGVSTLLAVAAQHANVAPNIGQAAVLPALWYVLGALGGFAWGRGRPIESLGLLFGLGERGSAVVAAAITGGLAAAVGVFALGGVLLSIGLVVGFSQAIVLTEALQPTALGIVALTIGQLALLPTAVVWASAWIIGPGFAIGTGSSVTPISTDLGPVPSVPLLAAIPVDPPSVALAVVVLPVLVGAVVGVLLRQRSLRGASAGELAIAAASSAILAGLIIAFASWVASGGVGPGRLAQTGPDVWIVSGIAVVEIGIGLAIGVWAGGFGGASVRTADADRGGRRDGTTDPLPDDGDQGESRADAARPRSDPNAETAQILPLLDDVQAPEGDGPDPRGS